MLLRCSESELQVKCRMFDFRCPILPPTTTDSCTRWPTQVALRRSNRRTLRSGYQPECRIQRPRYCASRGMVYASNSGPFFLICQISPSSASLKDSSASNERIQSWVAVSDAKFFCPAYPRQGLSTTRAPSLAAISAVRSLEPLSTTTISSQQRRLSMTRATLRSSLQVMIVADIFIAGRRRLAALFQAAHSSFCRHRSPERHSPAHIACPQTTDWDCRTWP